MTKKTLTIKGTVFGAGRPKIAVPVTADTMAAAVVQAQQAALPAVDVIEWRIDFLKETVDPQAIAKTARRIQAVISPRLLLVTLRTKQEGGQAQVSDERYQELYRPLLATRSTDLVDLELLAHSSACITALTTLAHDHQVKVIMSSHDFAKTPRPAALKQRLTQMEAVGADIVKLAVMPHGPADVLEVLELTQDYHLHGRLPLITMAMGDLGKITRVSGELFGSCLTFASVGRASAPGQIAVDELERILNALRI